MRRLAVAICLSAGVLAVGWPADALARIKLITLPVRERVEIQLDNPHATLVEEERIVPLVEGVNQVDFSWANTQIDPQTIVFRVLGPAAEKKADDKQPDDKQQADEKEGAEAGPLDVKVLSVSYPPNEAALVWQVSSSGSGAARVRISYLLGNLNKSFNYRAVAARDESTLTLSQYIRLQNLANEAFGSTGLWAGFGPRFSKPIGINQTKEMLIAKYEKVPVKKTYTANPQAFGYLDQPQNKLRIPMHYVLKNDRQNKMGEAALEAGKVRIFQEDGRGSTAFLGEDWGRFTPRDDEMRLYLGVAQDIVVKRTIDKNVVRRVAGNLHHREVVLKYEIENFKDQPAKLDVVENLHYVRGEVQGDTGRDVEWELGKETTFAGGPDKEQSAYDQAVFHVDLPARTADGKAKKFVYKLHVILKNEW
ncbi:MAG TPA: hypothetical protein VN699_21340 [Pirellulales bacterium]|nr:hypothetical protein [Pirellulales bacterium]